MGVLDGAGAEASVDTEACHFSNSCTAGGEQFLLLTWQAVAMVGAQKATRGQSCFHADSSSSRVPSVQQPESFLSHRQSSSSQQSQPDFPVIPGLCNPQQRKANSKTSTSLGFQDSGQPPGPS